MGDAEQLKAKAFIDRAYAAAAEVMKTVDGEAGSCLLETIIWLVKKRWNDQASMDQYLHWYYEKKHHSPEGIEGG